MTPFTIVHKETGLSVQEYAAQHDDEVPGCWWHGQDRFTSGYYHHADDDDFMCLIHESGQPAFGYEVPYEGHRIEVLDPSVWEVRYASPDVSQIMEATTPENSE